MAGLRGGLVPSYRQRRGNVAGMFSTVLRSTGLEDWLLPLVSFISARGIGPVRSISPRRG